MTNIEASHDNQPKPREFYEKNELALMAYDMGYEGKGSELEVDMTTGGDKESLQAYKDGAKKKEVDQKKGKEHPDDTKGGPEPEPELPNVTDDVDAVADKEVKEAENKGEAAVGDVLATEKKYREIDRKGDSLSTLADPKAVIDQYGMDHPFVERSYSLLFAKEPAAVFEHLDFLSGQPYARKLIYRTCRSLYEKDPLGLLRGVCENDPRRNKLTHAIDRLLSEAADKIVDEKPRHFEEFILKSPNGRLLLGDSYDKLAKRCEKNIRKRDRTSTLV